MREILFRGKCENFNKWVYGDLLTIKDTFRIREYTKFHYNDYLIVTDTIGQYTGLKDKNSVKIFEGDEMKGNRPVKIYGVPQVEKAFGTVSFKDGMFKLGNLSLCTFNDRMEVVGNIHDKEVSNE